ncbi:hypothetical protein [Rhodococcus zopfii]|uniref:hypothetical protein n=1 Tax=Rhodococcus zopfii TaxID=43772 RepID=UPI000AE0A317|nr:hypothetical protein [Rhodococcus zopfii]
MSDLTAEDWAERDRVARDALKVKVHPFGYGRYPKRGMVELLRDGVRIGTVSISEETDWLIETVRIDVKPEFRFRKDLDGYQERWALFLMQALFESFPDHEIRESPAINDAPGDPFVARVRGEYELSYHLSGCFQPSNDGSCVCGAGRSRA